MNKSLLIVLAFLVLGCCSSPIKPADSVEAKQKEYVEAEEAATEQPRQEEEEEVVASDAEEEPIETLPDDGEPAIDDPAVEHSEPSSGGTEGGEESLDEAAEPSDDSYKDSEKSLDEVAESSDDSYKDSEPRDESPSPTAPVEEKKEDEAPSDSDSDKTLSDDDANDELRSLHPNTHDGDDDKKEKGDHKKDNDDKKKDDGGFNIFKRMMDWMKIIREVMQNWDSIRRVLGLMGMVSSEITKD